MQRWNNDVMETTNKNNVEQYEEQEKTSLVGTTTGVQCTWSDTEMEFEEMLGGRLRINCERHTERRIPVCDWSCTFNDSPDNLATVGLKLLFKRRTP